MSKKKIALVINIIILVLELIGFGKSLIVDHAIAIEYYTNDSNLIALIASLLFIIFYKKDKEFVKDIRFIATGCLTVTILVVIFVLCPMYNFNYKLLMFSDIFLLFHTLVPILSIVSYLLFEERSNKTYLCLAFTIIYSFVLVLLNVFSVIEGPYPFLMVKNQSPVMTLVWGTLIIGGSYVIGIILNLLNKKLQK